MILNLLGKKRKDAIFIGSSRTLYHISTAIMKKHGLSIYNFGVSGRYLADYPSMIDLAIKMKPIAIILCLEPSELYEKLSIPKDVDLKDIVSYKNSNVSYDYIFQSLVSYVKNSFLINRYSTNIYTRLLHFYRTFEPNNTHHLRVRNALINPLFINSRHNFNNTFVKCKIFRVAVLKKMHQAMCTNGDGVLEGNNIYEDHQSSNKKYTNFNQNSYKLLYYLVSKIKNNHIKVVLVFPPQFHSNSTRVVKKEIKLNIESTPIINFTNMELPDCAWANEGHLNIYGRATYSNILAKKLKMIIGNN